MQSTKEWLLHIKRTLTHEAKLSNHEIAKCFVPTTNSSRGLLLLVCCNGLQDKELETTKELSTTVGVKKFTMTEQKYVEHLLTVQKENQLSFLLRDAESLTELEFFARTLYFTTRNPHFLLTLLTIINNEKRVYSLLSDYYPNN